MKWKSIVSLLAVLSFLGATARAQETPKVDIFVGYSYLQVNPGFRGVDSFHLHGGSASVAYNVKSWLGGVADFGGYNQGTVRPPAIAARSGPICSGSACLTCHFGKITPFGQVLFRYGTRQPVRFWHNRHAKCLCHDRGRRCGLPAA